MIIVDFSGILVANIHQLINLNGDFDDGLYRHMVFMSIMGYKKRFTESHGRLVFAIDSAEGYWRKDVFPHYKASRKKARELQQSKNSHVDWDYANKVKREIVAELDTVFPYSVIDIPKCEADDIIGTLCRHVNEKVIIISQDHDFKQLQRYPNITQHDPRTKKMIVEKNPVQYLKEHIIKGDSGDGVPNILSAADCLVTGVKQTGVKQVWLNSVMNKNVVDFAETSAILDRYRENEQLVDLTKTPEDLQEKIIAKYLEEPNGSNKNVQGYLIKNRLGNLMSELQYFMER